MSEICGAPVGAIPRRSAAGTSVLVRAAGDSDPKRERVLVESVGWQHGRNDPLGLRDAWIKARTAVQRFAESEKARRSARQQTKGDRDDPASSGVDRIKIKFEKLRQDLGIGRMDGNQVHKESLRGNLQKAEPPDKKERGDRPRNGPESVTEEGNYSPVI